jgi:hypothetical protein
VNHLEAITRAHLAELAPVLRRAASLDPGGLARVRAANGQLSVLVRLPFDVLVARTIAVPPAAEAVLDATMRTAELLGWLDDEGDGAAPQRHDSEWRSGLPPARGWQRIDTVPEDVVRGLVRSGASALEDAAAREGVPGAQPRPEVADALLDSVVLTVSADADADADADTDTGGPGTPVTLRVLSALTRMGFAPPGSRVAVDVAGRWTRVVGQYGSVYAERPGLGLQLL